MGSWRESGKRFAFHLGIERLKESDRPEDKVKAYS